MNQREKKTIHVYKNKMQTLFSTCTHTKVRKSKNEETRFATLTA